MKVTNTHSLLETIVRLNRKLEMLKALAKQLATELPHCDAPGRKNTATPLVCGQPARWLATWSDRELAVCDGHRPFAQKCHDGDHEYDQTGIQWQELHSYAALTAYEAYIRRADER